MKIEDSMKKLWEKLLSKIVLEFDPKKYPEKFTLEISKYSYIIIQYNVIIR